MRFFLKHHRPPEFTIRLANAIKLFRDAKERDGLRPRSLQSIAWTLPAFSVASAISTPPTFEKPPRHSVSKHRF